jgi:hypothetical protein
MLDKREKDRKDVEDDAITAKHHQFTSKTYHPSIVDLFQMSIPLKKGRLPRRNSLLINHFIWYTALHPAAVLYIHAADDP